MRSAINVLILAATVQLLAGCASISEGIARALMKSPTGEDTRQCYVRGPSFDGMQQLLDRASSTANPQQSGALKVLMVHGIGAHRPGYSTRLAENLASELQLQVVDREPRELTLRLDLSPDRMAEARASGRLRGQSGDAIGNLRVSIYRSKQDTRTMVFYELTWSGITEADKRLMAFDDSGEYAFRRADINRDLKSFVNAQLPDTLLYLGNAQLDIQLAVAQALCWMFTRDYDELPKQTDEACHFRDRAPANFARNSYVFVSHSLGSRILTDALQTVATTIPQSAQGEGMSNMEHQWQELLQPQVLTLFMLSNQLPLLQLGRAAPEVTGQNAAYCTPGGARYGQRIFSGTDIIAFSDPNDILSWAVPPDYANTGMDSRICPDLVNVIINVAEVKKVLGVEFASPGEAHRGYDNDSRVVKLMTHGLGGAGTDPMVQERCAWMEVRESDVAQRQ